jgi:hypothetical protein
METPVGRRIRSCGKESGMTHCFKDSHTFEAYNKSLHYLEAAFNMAGIPVRLHLFVAPLENKMVEITYKNSKQKKLLCIEGDSPVQVVKTISAAISYKGVV